MSARYTYIPASDPALLQMSKVELAKLAKGKSKKAGAAKDEIARRKANRAAKAAARRAA